jgi:hypothetical protein
MKLLYNMDPYMAKIRTSWQKTCVKQIFYAKYLELGKQNIRLITTNLMCHQ